MPDLCPNCKEARVFSQVSTTGTIIVVNEKGKSNRQLNKKRNQLAIFQILYVIFIIFISLYFAVLPRVV